MPELPEVETIRLGLERRIVGKTLKNIEVLSPKTFSNYSQKLRGNKVLNVWRRAKMLGIEISGNLTLVFHLKMTGQLVWVAGNKERETRLIGGHPTTDMRDQMPNKSTRVIFYFSDESKLYFNDQRKFGWVKVVNSSELIVRGEKILGKLGPEPLESGFDWEILKQNLLKHKSQPIKLALMDQSVVAGIGNIYANEVLFFARVDPRRKVTTLSDAEIKKIYQGIKESLTTAIKHGGSTRANFVNIEGEKGYFLDYANVYGKEGYKCNGCQGKIQKISLGGRGTYFCPACQK
ncbi:bifunctional DNA-formamidopyrimidine glycosylase/DNA-(apurinic or apyrimidinic site) lyase [Candidatus Daviesbacteria bacterium]|nr:bifunctional DNA-formamidopyrimidine glycosylase/DNA-(apurinic or apyrimidinic site) lyase [Candidatus Daviesbacteria bacterium]